MMRLLSLNYVPHQEFVLPAHDSSQVWRLVIGILLVAGIFFLLTQVIMTTFLGLLGPEITEKILEDGQTGETVVGMFLVLFQIGLLGVATGIVCVFLHKRKAITLIGPLRLAVRQFIGVALALLVLSLTLWMLPPYGFDEPLVQNMNKGDWLMLLPFAVIAVFVQSGSEEVFFRGYIQQQLAARFRKSFVWLVLPAVLFGLVHYMPDSAGSNALTIALWATVFGLLMADLTARSGTLGPAIAVHFFNNFSAIVLVGIPDEMSGLALFVLPFGMSDEGQMALWLPVDFALIVVGWLVARLVVRA